MRLVFRTCVPLLLGSALVLVSACVAIPPKKETPAATVKTAPQAAKAKQKYTLPPVDIYHSDNDSDGGGGGGWSG